MTNYDHILLIVEGNTNANTFAKANLLANCFGARLSIGHYLPQLPTTQKGVVNIETECREMIKSQLRKLGKLYKIPVEDQWVLSQNENDSLMFFKKHAIDFIILDKNIQSFLLRSQLANKIFQHYSCGIDIVNS